MKQAAKKTVFGDMRTMIRAALQHRNACHNLTHAALVLMAANRKLTPHDAFMDACQMYCHVLEVKRRWLNTFPRHGVSSTAARHAATRKKTRR